jgi:hypothetical protein
MASGTQPDSEPEDQRRPAEQPIGASSPTPPSSDIWAARDQPATVTDQADRPVPEAESWRRGERTGAEERGGRGFAFLRELPFLLLVAFLLALLIKTFVVQAFYIPSGTVLINGRPLSEPYIKVKDERPCGPYRVEPDHLFVMGDNRLNSRDSRYGLGQIPYDKVIGRAFVIIWPPSRIGWLRGS